MRHKKILFIGSSFAGKTYIAEQFRQRGLPAVDSEKIPGIVNWRNVQKYYSFCIAGIY